MQKIAVFLEGFFDFMKKHIKKPPRLGAAKQKTKQNTELLNIVNNSKNNSQP